MYLENDVAVSSTQQGFMKNETNWSFSLIKLLDDYNNPENAINNIIFKGSSFFFFLLAMLHGLWDLSSPTRDWTQALGSESMES